MTNRTGNNQHTPGPWRIAENEWNLKDPPWRGAVTVEGDVNTDWAVPPLVCSCYRGGEEHANAHLIAAAPELLEAAIAVLEPYKTLTDDALVSGILMEFGPPKPEKGAALLLIRKAIALATDPSHDR